MDIPPIGFLIIVIVVLVAVARPRSLIYLSAFFVPFSGTSVMNVSAFELGIVAFTFTALIWLGTHLMMGLFLHAGVVVVAWREPLIRYLVLFLFVIAASLIMPVIIDGQEHFLGAGILGYINTYAIQFSIWHLIHLGYVVIGTLFVMTASAVIRHDQRIESMIRWYVLGGTFAAIVGLLEVLLNLVGLSFPIEFFNSVPTSDFDGAGRFDGQLGLLRISSVAQETSLFGTHLSVIFALVWVHLMSGRTIFSKTVDFLIAGMIGAALIFSLSTVAYAGLGLTVGFATLLSLKSTQRVVRALILLAVLISGVIVTVAVIPESGNVMNYFIFEKGQSGSFLERISTVINAFSLAMRYPILGVGWGLVPSFDLFVKIFVGAGILGVVAFLLLWGSVLRSVQKTRRALRYTHTHVISNNAPAQADGLLVAFLTLTCIYTVNGFEYRYGDFWVLLTLIAAIGQRYVSRCRGSSNLVAGIKERGVSAMDIPRVSHISSINLN